MANPFVQSLFKPTDFDLFLDEIGLANVTGRDRIQLVDKILQSVEYQLVTVIFRQLSTEQQEELVKLMQTADESGDEAPVNQFLQKTVPNVETLVDEAIEKVKNDLRLSTASMQDSIGKQLALIEFAKKSGEPATEGEEFNPPSIYEGLNEDQSPTQPIPAPIKELAESKERLFDDQQPPLEIAPQEESSAPVIPPTDSETTTPPSTDAPSIEAPPVAPAQPDQTALEEQTKADLDKIRGSLQQSPTNPAGGPTPTTTDQTSDSSQAIDQELNSVDQ